MSEFILNLPIFAATNTAGLYKYCFFFCCLGGDGSDGDGCGCDGGVGGRGVVLFSGAFAKREEEGEDEVVKDKKGIDVVDRGKALSVFLE